MAKLKWERAQEDNIAQRQGAEYVKKEFHISGNNLFHCPYCLEQVKYISEHIEKVHKQNTSGIKLRKSLEIENKLKYKETLLTASNSKANLKKTETPNVIISKPKLLCPVCNLKVKESRLKKHLRKIHKNRYWQI